MKEGSQDRRVQRTRQMLLDALKALIIDKGYESITIQDIIDRANLGRSTFYAHFYDKEDLLKNGIDQLKDSLLQELVSMPKKQEEDALFPRLSFSLAMIEHVKDHVELYQAMVGKQSGAFLLREIQGMIVDLVKEEMKPWLHTINHPSLPGEIIMHHSAMSFITMITWWLDQSMPCSADELDHMFHVLIMKGIWTR
jgi:AcrR family transcriptional regulator